MHPAERRHTRGGLWLVLPVLHRLEMRALGSRSGRRKTVNLISGLIIACMICIMHCRRSDGCISMRSRSRSRRFGFGAGRRALPKKKLRSTCTGPRTNSATEYDFVGGDFGWSATSWEAILTGKSPQIAPNRLFSRLRRSVGRRFGLESRAVGRIFFAKSGSFWSTPWHY